MVGSFILSMPSIFGRMLCVASIILIKFYRCVLSPLKICLFGASCRCRFEPTCSQYALDAYANNNFLKATFLTAARLIKCQPFHGRRTEQ